MLSGSLAEGAGGRPDGVVQQVASPADLVAWVQRLAILDQGRSVPEMMVRMEQLAAADLDLETRYRVLRAVKRPLLRVAAGLTRTVPHPGSGLSLEQRLYAAMIRNLGRLMEDLERTHRAPSPYRQEQHRWAVRNLFRFIERELLCAVRTDAPWPPGVWQSLHDLFMLMVDRARVGLRREGTDPGPPAAFDPEHSYKWMLAIGLAADTLGRKRVDRETMLGLGELARQSFLIGTESLVGEYGLVLVEVSRDAPARVQREPLAHSIRGWALRTPAPYRGLLAGIADVPSELRMEARP